MITTTKIERVRSVSAVTRASDLFRRYKKEKPQAVRSADVTDQSLAERIQRTREMLRGMKPEAVIALLEYCGSLNFFKAIALAQRENKLIVPNDIHDRILTETNYGESGIPPDYPVITGTFIIYEAPDKKFGKRIKYRLLDEEDVEYCIKFHVPKQFQSKINCALVVEYPNFELVALGGNNYELRVTNESNLSLVENFPREAGWYKYDERFRIPIGDKMEDQQVDNTTRNLKRVNLYIGPLVRDYLGGTRQKIFADWNASPLDVFMIG